MIGIIGGSGLYEMEGLKGTRWKAISTPFGKPSDDFLIGEFEGCKVAFLPRHGRGHRILPSELNHRANIWGFKSLGAKFIISVSAVGSLKEEFRPLDVVLPDQFLDRTKKSLEHTFFGGGIVAHVAFADPICKELQAILHQEASSRLSRHGLSPSGKAESGSVPRAHFNGTYVNMEGPAFSTRAESHFYRSLGGSVIGMTNLGEAKLAREAEIAYATMAMVTDYDCWKTDEEPVTAETVIHRLKKNAENAKAILRAAIPKIALGKKCSCHTALSCALVTDRKLWPASTVRKLKPILSSYLAGK